MINSKFRFLMVICLGLLTLGCGSQKDRQSVSLMEGGFWKNQAINDIIIPWTNNGLNPRDGTFPAYMDRQWKPFQDDHTYPGMIARHVFSYSTAYMLTGDDKYLDIAERIVQYMIQHGWDTEYGLWFNEIDEEGDPVEVKKDMFMQLYAVTGLAMYYVVTRDREVSEYIEDSINLLNKHAWDSRNGGYTNILGRDLSVEDPAKKATPQLAPLSGYLAYLYPVTQKEQYLNEMTRGVEIILDYMMPPPDNWLLESFDKQWKLNSEQSRRVNVGHNLEIVWMLLRLHLLTGNEGYKDTALKLYPPLFEASFNSETGAWYHSFMRKDTQNRPDTTPWWIQAYGNMLELYMYRITGNQDHLNNFQKGARFWNNYFMDKEFGGAFLKVGIDGKLADGNKAVRSKTSYHSMEHGLLNYLYLNLWVQGKPVTLNFRIDSSEDGDMFYPDVVEDPEVRIKAVRINGKRWEQYHPEEGSVILPALKKGTVQVELVR